MKGLVIGGVGGVEREAAARRAVLVSEGLVGAVPVVEIVTGAVREGLVPRGREASRLVVPADRVRREAGLRVGAGFVAEETGVVKVGAGVQGLPDAIVVRRLQFCRCPS